MDLPSAKGPGWHLWPARPAERVIVSCARRVLLCFCVKVQTVTRLYYDEDSLASCRSNVVLSSFSGEEIVEKTNLSGQSHVIPAKMQGKRSDLLYRPTSNIAPHGPTV